MPELCLACSCIECLSLEMSSSRDWLSLRRALGARITDGTTASSGVAGWRAGQAVVKKIARGEPANAMVQLK
jgi:hypothetical protein